MYSLMEAMGMKLHILALIWTITGKYIAAFNYVAKDRDL